MDSSETSVARDTVQNVYAQGHLEEYQFRQETPGRPVLLEHDSASPGV